MGVLFVHLQQIQRLVAPLQRLVEDSRKKETALCIPMPLCKEICAEPYEAFSPKQWPCWVLLEVDANLTIRPYQPDFARHTLEPSKNLNAISELGVGLGKTAVVTPMVATAIADGSVSEGPPREPRLSEVLVLAPLLKGNVEDLAFRLGGLLNRRVHTLSFKRDRALIPKLLDQLLKSLEECKDRRGVLVWLPDAKQSLLLRQQEMADSDQPIGAGKEKRSPEYRLELVKRLGRINAFFARYGRGLIDEADSVLHYKNQLVYAVGKQNPLEGGELRRLVPFAVLRLLTDVAPEALCRFPSALEIPHIQKWKAQKRRYKKELQVTEENAGASSSSSGVQGAPEGDEDIEDEMDRSALPGSHMFFPVRLLRNASADSLGLTATPESHCVAFLVNAILRNIWAGDAPELRLPDVEERRRRWYNIYILQQWHDGNDLPSRRQDRLFSADTDTWQNDKWKKFRHIDSTIENFWIGKPTFEAVVDGESRKKLWDKREKYISDISEAVELFWKVPGIPCPEKTAVMELRGLFSGPQIFVHCLSERYRVNFGVDPRVEDVARRARVEIAHNETLRQMGMTKNLGPPMSVAEVVGREGKRLSAVPFRGKDKPADRTEFANPDVAVMFTLLSYFYQGLGEAEILEVLEDLQSEPNPDATWRFWLHSVRNPEKRRFHVNQAFSVSAVALRRENLQNMRKKKEREQALREARRKGQDAMNQKRARKNEQRRMQANPAELRRMERAEQAKVLKEKKNAAVQAKRKEIIERKNMWQKLTALTGRMRINTLSGATSIVRILKDRCVQLYDIPPSIIDRRSVNSDDAKQLKLLVAILSRHMDVIAFWLERRVFSFESKVFPARISASGWSLCLCPDARRLQMAVSLGDEFRLRKLPPPSTGDEATDLTNVKETFADLGDEGNRTVDGPAITGFSGTSETQLLLPGTAEQDDMPSLLGTVGVNLLRLVRRENFLYKALEPGVTGEELIKSIARLPPDNKFPMVILDGGALVVELSNETAATVFLMEARANRRRLGGNARLPEAVVFFDKKDELVVKDARGRVSPLRLSPFFSCMRDALAFLDDSHTRGVDLPGLPEDAVAAYTLGKGVSLDKLLQGVGRMRLLGQGQSVRFLAAAEVDRHIREKLRGRVGGKGTMQELMESVVGQDLNDLIVPHHRQMPNGDARQGSAVPTRVPSANGGVEAGRRRSSGDPRDDEQGESEGRVSIEEEGEEGDRERGRSTEMDDGEDGEEGQNLEDEDEDVQMEDAEDVQEVEEAAFDAAMRAREAEKEVQLIDLDREDEEALHPSLFDVLDHALLESQAVIKNGVLSWLQQCASRMQTEVAQAEAAHVLAPGFGADKDSSDEDSDGDGGRRKKKESTGSRRPQRAAAAAAAARMQQGREAEDDEDSSEDDRDEEEEAGSEHEDGGERMRAVRKRRRAKEKERAEREGEMDRNIARLSCRVLATLGREREKISLVEMYGHEGSEKIEFLEKYAHKKFKAVSVNCEEKKGRMIQQEDNKGLDSDESPLTDVVCVRVKPYAKHVGKCLPKRKGQNAMNALALGDEQERELEQEVLPVKPEDPVEVIRCKEVPQGFTVHSALWDVLTGRFATVQEFLRDCVSLETSQYPVNRERWPRLDVHKSLLHNLSQVISGSRAHLALDKVVLPLGDRQREGFQPPIRYSPNYDGEAIYKAQTNKTPKVTDEEGPENPLQPQSQQHKWSWTKVVTRALEADGLVPSAGEEAGRRFPVDVQLRSRNGAFEKVMLPPKTFGLDLYFTDDFRDVLDADEAAKLRVSQVVGQERVGTGLDLFLRTPKFVVSIRESSQSGRAALVCLGPHEAESLFQKTVHRELRIRNREKDEEMGRGSAPGGGGGAPRGSMGSGGRGSMGGGRHSKRSLDGHVKTEGGVKVPKSENDPYVRVKQEEEDVPVPPSPPRQQSQQQQQQPDFLPAVRRSSQVDGRASRGLLSLFSSIHLLSPRKEPEQPSLFLDSRLALPPLKIDISLLPVGGAPEVDLEGMEGEEPGIPRSSMAGGMHRASVLSTQRGFRRVSAGAGGFAFSVTDFWESTPANENLRRLLSTLLFLSGNLFFAHVKEEEEVCRLLSLLPKPFLPKFAEWRTAFDNSVSRGFFPPVAMSGGQTMWLDEKVVDAARSLAKRLDDEGRRCFFKTSPVPFVKALLTARRQINRLTDSHLGSLVESHSRTLGLPGAPPGEREEAERLERELEERKRKEKEEAEREQEAEQQEGQEEGAAASAGT
uniref:ubiquitinyl hydrolase 1 n=1 Tax=Chromera velia CCMP2878 TaxID=1169474 RepID=A0A0G4HK66_9ALVE|eukprot:Cvel_28446.t1-p1 / transcript=Cvel_28446.t1 / gene=Cvel_28446 / organism=Chromera_velia_CCMP2878 / gene_product=hypothetical protein / transcript_product=hypothetical protein / location=Cvel_scaffold3727:3275-11232(-) / protein_length=2235 / sequence_SO=supercontig / SO=protein_coding / is_pseudo=false